MRGSSPGWEARFPPPVQKGTGAHNGDPVFPEDRVAWASRWASIPSSTKGKERVKLYLYNLIGLFTVWSRVNFTCDIYQFFSVAWSDFCTVFYLRAWWGVLMIGVRCCDELMICGDHKPKQTLIQRQWFDSKLQDIPQRKTTSMNAVQSNGIATHCNRLSSMTWSWSEGFLPQTSVLWK